MVIVQTPRNIFITGADLGGTSGDGARTYTLAHSTTISPGTIKVYQDSVFLQKTADWTRSGTTLTFVNTVWDDQRITISYFTSDESGADSSTTYGTTQQLARYMGIEGVIPDRSAVGSTRQLESIGTGDNATTQFFLDNANVLANTYTISYGDAVTAVTSLTETTDYTIDKDNGEITLTGTGVTTITTATLFGKYSYNNVGISDTVAQEALDRAQTEIDQRTNSHFADGTVATPDYKAVTDEKQRGKGPFYRDYFIGNRPVPPVTTTLSSTIATGDSTATVVSTDGFLSSGTIGIGESKISYTSKDSTNFIGVTGIAATHSTNTQVDPTVIELSTTTPGATATWMILSVDKDYDIDKDTGRVHVYDHIVNNINNSIWADNAPLFLIPDRFRTNYIWSNNTIPNDIQRLTLMLASKDLMHLAVRKATASGRNEFNASMIGVDDDWITNTIDRYLKYRISNV